MKDYLKIDREINKIRLGYRCTEGCCISINEILDVEIKKYIKKSILSLDSSNTPDDKIVNYDFYRPENILVVDKNNPVIPKDFIDTPWKEIPDEIYKKYSISSWLETIFN